MELEFQKTEIPCLHTILRQVQTQEQTQEVRLSDEMPDIGRVLSCWGQVMLRGKEWRTGALSVNGGVMVWVLYAPEDGSAMQCLQTWLPMQIKCDLPGNEPDGDIIAVPALYSVDARSTASRKMIVRASVGVCVDGICPGKENVYGAQDLPDDVFKLENKYPVCIPSETGEKAFSVDEIIKLPATYPEPAKILRYALQPEIAEQRLLSDKLIFRGTAVAHILYIDKEGKLHSYEAEVPISQYAELKEDHPEDSDALVCVALTNLEVDVIEDCNLQVKAGLVAQYCIFDCTTICVTEDAYSPSRQIKPEVGEMKVPVVLERRTQMLTAEWNLKEDNCAIVDVAFYPEHPRMYRDDGMVTAELSGNFHILYTDAEGMLRSEIFRWEDKREWAAASEAKVNAVLTSVGIDNAGNDVKLRMDITVTGESGVPMVMGLEMGDICEQDPERPSLILRKLGDKRLWDIAKENGSSVDMIKKINNIQQEPDEERMLLIPVL